jgi:uncharacterized protein (DUF1800 family)
VTSQWDATARLLRRTGFGTTATAVDAAVTRGSAASVTKMLAADPARDPGALATPVPTFEPVPVLGKGASKQQRQDRNGQIRDQLLSLTTWWLRRMVAVTEPFGEKLTFVWHNHFATAATKVRSAPAMASQNATLRRLSLGDFHTLAYAMLTDAAMLRWLDGEKNTAKAPNENLAREFMELFTLGHGDAYTEQDVREGARALTGWKIRRDGTTRVLSAQHDSGMKTVLGATGNLDAAGFCSAVLAEPGSARYLATRLWGQFVSGEAPPPGVVDRLVAAYGPNRDVAALLGELLSGPHFDLAKGTVVANPVEWLVGAVRSLHVPVSDEAAAKKLVVVLRALGQIPFYPPNVSGWPSGQAWLSTAAADARLRAATALARAAQAPLPTGSVSTRVNAVGQLLGVGTWSNRTAAALRDAAADPHRLVAVALNTPEYLTD